jgi:DNA-binding GntR family transcriptional regulator
MTQHAQRESAADRVYRWVRARILDGSFAAGRLLSEGEVADAVHLSRTPVREAFLQLAAEDMLELYPKRGALVVAVNTAELREVLVARSLIEPWAVRRLTARPDRGAAVDQLRTLTDQAREALERDDQPAFQEADRAFHQRILAATGNELLAGFYASLRDRQLRAGMQALGNDPARGRQSRDEHDTAADAVERGDADAAAASVRRHLEGTATALGLARLG